MLERTICRTIYHLQTINEVLRSTTAERSTVSRANEHGMRLVVIRSLLLIVECYALDRAGRVTCCSKFFSRIDMLRIGVTPAGVDEVSCKLFITQISLNVAFQTSSSTRYAHPAAIYAIANGANVEIIGSLTRKAIEGIIQYVRSLNLGSSLKTSRIKRRCAGNELYIVADGVVNERPLNSCSLARSTSKFHFLNGLIRSIFIYREIIQIYRSAVLIITEEEQSLLTRNIINEEAVSVPTFGCFCRYHTRYFNVHITRNESNRECICIYNSVLCEVDIYAFHLANTLIRC